MVTPIQKCHSNHKTKISNELKRKKNPDITLKIVTKSQEDKGRKRKERSIKTNSKGREWRQDGGV